MRNTRAARRYAAALIALGKERGTVDAMASDLESVARTIEASRELRLLLASPNVSAGKKLAIVEQLFSRRIGKDTLAFLRLLIQKKREEQIPDVIGQFLHLRDENEGIVTADVTAAVDMTPVQENQLTGRLEKYTGKRVRLRPVRDTSIIGGMIVRIGDTVLNGSIQHQLELLRAKLVEG